jgi:hypothetical protein
MYLLTFYKFHYLPLTASLPNYVSDTVTLIALAGGVTPFEMNRPICKDTAVRHVQGVKSKGLNQQHFSSVGDTVPLNRTRVNLT